MKNCLETKLKAFVDNSNLEYLNYLHCNVHQVESPNANNYSVSVLTTNTSVDKIIATGSGHFTDSTLQEDRGQEVYCNGNGQKFSNGNYQLLLPLTGIIRLTAGSTSAPPTDWQVDLNFERLFRNNADTLTKVCLKQAEGNYGCMKYAKKVTDIIFFTGTGSMEKYMSAIVDSNGRISDDINFQYFGGSDIYSGGGAIRMIKNIVPGTSYSVYNSNGTQLLFTALKTGGVWQYTRA